MESADIPDSFIELTVQKKEKFTLYRYHNHKLLPNNPVYDQMDFLYPINQAKGRHGFGIKSIKKS